jgi:hypothetical protein
MVVANVFTRKDSDSSSEYTMENSAADLATDTRGCETTQSANADISLNGIVVLRYTPATELARALEQLEKADESEI